MSTRDDSYEGGESPANKVIYIAMAPYHLQYLRGKDLENCMDFGRDMYRRGLEDAGAATAKPVAPEAPRAKWAWWLEHDETCHIEPTEAACHGAAADNIDSDTQPGIVCKYIIARTAHPLDAIAHDKLAVYLGTNIHEDIDVRCADETGAEEESLSITDQDKIGLGQLVLDFLRGRAKVEWWGIDKKTVAGHTYVAGGDGGDGDDDASGGVAQ